MRAKLFMAATLWAAALTLPSLAQDQEQERFQLEKLQDGFIRLDRKSGDVSYCKQEQSGLICRMAADERKAFEQELDALTKRVERLEKTAREPASTLPSDAEVEKSLSIMERFFRRFMDIIGETKQEPTPAPDRT